MTPMMCMAVALFFEARGEDVDGMIMVGKVIENRVASSRYPDTVCGVVNQKKQFSYTHDGLSDNPEDYPGYYDKQAWKTAKQVAQVVISGNDDFDLQATHYHADYVSPYWKAAYTVEAKHGKHIFYRE